MLVFGGVVGVIDSNFLIVGVAIVGVGGVVPQLLYSWSSVFVVGVVDVVGVAGVVVGCRLLVGCWLVVGWWFLVGGC